MPVTMNRSRKLKRNDDMTAIQSQQQTRRRHQTNDNMLNTVQLNQHDASMIENETHHRRNFDQEKSSQMISVENVPDENDENVIIGICTKLLRKCFFSTQCSPVSVVSRIC